MTKLDFQTLFVLIMLASNYSTVIIKQSQLYNSEEKWQQDLADSYNHSLINNLDLSKTNYRFLLNSHQCNNAPKEDALIIVIVHSGPRNLDKRIIMRNIWEMEKKLSFEQIRLVFILEPVKDENDRWVLEEENRQNNDLILALAPDEDIRLLHKDTLGFKWVTFFCQNAQIVIEIDEDAIIDVLNLKTEKSSPCYLINSLLVKSSKDEKIKVISKESNTRYCMGGVINLSLDVVFNLLQKNDIISFKEYLSVPADILNRVSNFKHEMNNATEGVGITYDSNIEARRFYFNRFAKTSIDHNYSTNISEVMKLFDKMGSELKVLQEMFYTKENKNSKQSFNRRLRITRSVLDKRLPCSVSKDKLSDLLLGIKNAIPNEGSNNCEYISVDSDNCDEMVKLLQCGFGNLENGFSDAMKNKSSLEEIQKYKNAYDRINETYQELFDELKQSVSQETGRQIVKLQTDLQGLGLTLQMALENLKKTTRNLCISNIHSGRINAAFGYYKELEDESELPEIIKSTYNYLGDGDNSNKKIKNLYNILKFIPKLIQYSQVVMAFQSLYIEIGKNNYLNNQGMQAFQQGVAESLSSWSSNISQADTDKLGKYLIYFWVTAVQKGDYEPIKSYLDKFPTSKNILQKLLPKIVQSVYDSEINRFRNTIKFVRELQWVSLRYTGYYVLYHEMKRNKQLDKPELLILFFRIREAMEDKNAGEFFLKLLLLSYQFPRGILALYSDIYVTMESSKYPGYTLYGGAFEGIHVYPEKDWANSSTNNQKWFVTTTEQDGRIFFTFINLYNFKALSSSSYNYYNADNAEVDENSKLQQWEVTPVINGEYFYLKNRQSNYVLDANDQKECSRSKSLLCSTAHLYAQYTATNYHHWKIY